MTKWIAGLLLATLLPLAALAQEPAPPAQADSTRRRHLGFFIRPELGFSYFATSASQGGTDLKLSGGGLNLGLAVGGAVTENFIVGAQVWDYVVASPDVTLNGQSLGSATDASVGLVGLGVLLNWYIMPSNLYLAVTPSLTQIVVDNGTTSATSEWGFGVRAAFGKEWWVGSHWGLGLAASMGLSSNKDTGIDPPTWGSFALGLNFSATYN